MRTLTIALFALCCVSAHAGTILYTDSGTFSGSTPSTVFSGPDETWAFSFLANTNPAPLSDVGMGGFSFTFSGFSYSLDGSPVVAPPTLIRFFSGTNFGGFAICFNGATFSTCTEGLATDGPQMYTGTTSAPTLIPGAFAQATGSFAIFVSGTDYFQPDTTLQATAVPEPSALLTLAAGLFALGASRLYRRR